MSDRLIGRAPRSEDQLDTHLRSQLPRAGAQGIGRGMSELGGHAEVDPGRMVAPSGMAGRPLWIRLIVTVLLAAGLGPLVGTALMFFLASVANDLLPAGMATEVQSAPVPFAVFLGYFLGGLQAILCGIVFAACGWHFGRLRAWTVVAVALPLAFLFNLTIFGMSLDSLSLSVFIHLVPALVVWWLVRPYWQRTEA